MNDLPQHSLSYSIKLRPQCSLLLLNADERQMGLPYTIHLCMCVIVRQAIEFGSQVARAFLKVFLRLDKLVDFRSERMPFQLELERMFEQR